MGQRVFFAELKRRNVYKVAVAYAVVAWLVIQVAATIVPALHLPDTITTTVVVIVLLGFPIALVLAWAFEMTPEGIRRADDLSPSERRGKSHAWIYVVAISIALSVGLFFAGRYTASSTSRSSATGDKSIAVLPLVNQSGDTSQEYFSDGLSEELINGLGKIAELRVIGRNSSFHFKGKTDDSRAIGQALGVANLLEGSVRKAGDRVRIGLQLVNAADGTQRWSETYDRELKDIFAIQEEIAKAVAEQLRLRLLGGAQSVSSQPSNASLTAYDFFLQARAEYDKANVEAAARAISLLDQAIALDPKYAEAYVLKARALSFIANSGGVPGREMFEKARAAVGTALTLKPDDATAHSALSYIYLYADWNVPAAEAELAGVREKDATVLNNLASLRLIQGRTNEATSLRREVLRLEPLHAVYYVNDAQDLMRAGQWSEAEVMLRKALELQPSARWAHSLLAFAALNNGDLDLASREVELEPAGWPRDGMRACVLFAKGDREQADQVLQQLIAKFGDDNPVTIAQVYSVRREPENVFEWLERAYQRHQPSLIFSLAGNPAYRSYYSEPRFVALCNKIGVAVPK